MFLSRILETQAAVVARSKAERPLTQIFRELDRNMPELRPFKERLTGDSLRIIAEVKKASPSKGLLCPDFNPEALGTGYERAGAAAISVLTEATYFQGSLEYLQVVKTQTQQTPVLRKDFIIDPYQLAEARLYGADAVLLIVAALTPRSLEQLLREAGRLGLTPLVEVHNLEELQIALASGAEVIGINNRNLQTFEVTLATTYRLLEALPDTVVKISESGITSRADLVALEKAGVNAVLIGEALVTAADPQHKIKGLLGVVS
ncbi:MAG TPA: indole-3-glycerol phosphate synthase TrpC [Bacillota bacterium]|nr:indole-3-glycerol phosphate synthase TrpC [Bacillota bacterium]